MAAMDDVIGQGREPQRDARPPLPRRWRVAGTLIMVVAGLAVAGVGLRHAAGQTGASRPSASTSAVPAPAAVITALPVPQSNPVIAVCAPSTGACWIRISSREHKAAETVAPTP